MNRHESKATTCCAGRLRHRVLVYACGADCGDRLGTCLAMPSCTLTQGVPNDFNSERDRKLA